MSKYKYNEIISQKIIEIVVKDKEDIYPNKLYEKVKESISSPKLSDDKIKSTRQQLEDWHLLKRRKGEKNKDIFYLSELCKVILDFNYRPHYLPIFLLKLHTICLGAFAGFRYIDKSTEPSQRGDIWVGMGLIVDDVNQIDPKKTELVRERAEIGISKEDLLNKRKFFDVRQYPDFSSQEIDKYFDFLQNNGFIIPSYMSGNSIKYILSPDLEDFYMNCYVPLNFAVFQRFSILASDPKMLRKDDRKWYILHHGQERYDAIFKLRKIEKTFDREYWLKKGITSREIYQEEKKKKETRERKLKEANNYLLSIYELIIEKYRDKEIGVSGLKELLISLICPPNILTTVKKDLHVK